MTKYTCSTCENEFEEDYFDNEQNKCILHCTKDDWFDITNTQTKNWNKSKDKISKFWSKIQNILDSSRENKPIKFINIIFPHLENEYEYKPEYDEDGFQIGDNRVDMGTNFYSFDYYENSVNKIFETSTVWFINCTFLDSLNLLKYNFSGKLVFLDCNFYGEIYFPLDALNCSFKFENCNFHNNILKLSHREINKKFTLKYCKEIKSLRLNNSRLKEVFSVFRSQIKFSNFENTVFYKDAIFDEATFSDNLFFKYANFQGNGYFQNLTIKKKLCLQNTTFRSIANFLGLKANNNFIENRETARIIKNSFEQQNNIIEANKFYALEMKEREKELDTDVKKGKIFSNG